jgi:hypothetical protein
MPSLAARRPSAVLRVLALTGNRGNQQYRIPHDVVASGRSVVIWCRAFSAPFGSARLV